MVKSYKSLGTLRAEEATAENVTCNKDTGERQKSLRKWSRGILHFVRGGGHIEKWAPLYQ